MSDLYLALKSLMMNYSTIILLVLSFCSCQSQEERSALKSAVNPIGGPCEICHLYAIDMPSLISNCDTSTLWNGQLSEMIITGQVFQRDGKTPAPDVVLFYWHTDLQGIYPPPAVSSAASRLGSIRGWLKTDSLGRYTLHTVRPAPYPDGGEPSHIHWIIKEPEIETPYYIDAMVFDDDTLLTGQQRKELEQRGGSMILRPVYAHGKEIAEKNIILGLNIPNYPEEREPELSGLPIGEESPSFTPDHAFGPDAGSTACPVCKYGRYHGILYFVNEPDSWRDVENWLVFFEEESKRRAPHLKVYLIYSSDGHREKVERDSILKNLGLKLDLMHIALTHVADFDDKVSEVYLNKINPEVRNTLIIYRQRGIVDKYIDLQANKSNFQKISDALDQTLSPFFAYPETWTLKER